MTPRWHRYAFMALAVLLVAIVLFPVYWMLVTSLLPSSIVLSRRPPLLPPLDAVSLRRLCRSVPSQAGADVDGEQRDRRRRRDARQPDRRDARRLQPVALSHAGAAHCGRDAAAVEDAARRA